LVGGSNEPG